MNDYNKIGLTGRLTKDSELTFMQSGSAKLEFSIAFTTSRKNGNEWVDEPNYLNGLTLWGKTAENMKNYLKKGTQVLIEGHLKMDKWEKDGQTKTLMKVVVDNLHLIGGNKSNSTTNTQVKVNVPTEETVPEASYEGFQSDIPF